MKRSLIDTYKTVHRAMLFFYGDGKLRWCYTIRPYLSLNDKTKLRCPRLQIVISLLLSVGATENVVASRLKLVHRLNGFNDSVNSRHGFIRAPDLNLDKKFLKIKKKNEPCLNSPSDRPIRGNWILKYWMEAIFLCNGMGFVSGAT